MKNILTIFAMTVLLTLITTSMAMPVSPVPAADAAAIYAAKCAKCHGSDGSGVEKYKKKGQKAFTDTAWQKTRSDAQLTASITNGKGEAMAAWKSKLTTEEIKALVAYVRSLKK
jgi:cbb3-type cytochrome c oxidase subunit III